MSPSLRLYITTLTPAPIPPPPSRLAPYSFPYQPAAPDSSKTLPDAHIHSEERGCEMPHQQPALGALN